MNLLRNQYNTVSCVRFMTVFSGSRTRASMY